MALLIKNIKKLVQTEEKPIRWRAGKDMQDLPCIDDAFLLTVGDKIADYGKMSDFSEDMLKNIKEKVEIVDAAGKMVFPAFCDSHSHLVYAGSREIEYIDKIKGLSYEEIAKRGGGILNSCKRLRAASEDELFEDAWKRLEEVASFGTGAIEIKSGYGLTTEDELKMLRVIRRLKEKSPLTIKANFLGAHAVPMEYIGRQTEYVDLIINDPTARTDDGKPVRIIRRAETNLGDLCADAYLEQSGGADIAFVNGGGIRVAINAGDITLNDILKVHPFGNALTVIEISGQQVLDALEWSVHSLPGEFGGFDHVAGLTFEYDASVPSPCVEDASKMFDHVDESMTRRVRNVLVAGEPLDPEKIYKVVSHDYQLLNNGDGYTMFAGANVLQESVKLDNQVLIDYITGTLGGVVSEGYEEPYGQGRIVEVNAAE